ncbi:jg6239 [Pararge aegeria aegeria]|uniref:Jg6239 protein n=1 Tax=Pararge aegeria aegeria TaxID=348720 RepID=A0A8S4RAI2_9NEOP|nr:jg6239 [Pararge aegeria aegeria]
MKVCIDGCMDRDHASALVGNTARLRCRIDGKSCGEMHSIKWYKTDTRVYVYSASKDAAINRPEGDMMNSSLNSSSRAYIKGLDL